MWPRLSISHAVGDLQLGVAVPVEHLRPKPKHAQITFAAVYVYRASSKKPDGQEQELRLYIVLLKENARRFSNATNKILRYHVQFASLMAQRIDDVPKSQYNLIYDNSETTRIANYIREASDSLSTYVTQIKENLKLFVSVLEEVHVTMKKEPSWAEWILGWLKYLFKSIAMIFATIYPFNSESLRLHPDLRIRGFK